jgi:hypothetical protein
MEEINGKKILPRRVEEKFRGREEEGVQVRARCGSAIDSKAAGGRSGEERDEGTTSASIRDRDPPEGLGCEPR